MATSLKLGCFPRYGTSAYKECKDKNIIVTKELSFCEEDMAIYKRLIELSVSLELIKQFKSEILFYKRLIELSVSLELIKQFKSEILFFSYFIAN